MKLLNIVFLCVIYMTGVRSAAIGVEHEGYNYEKPEEIFEQQAPVEQTNPIELIAQRVAYPLEANLELRGTIANNEITNENNADIDEAKQEFVADDIDQLNQVQPAEIEKEEESDVSHQSSEQITIQNVDQDSRAAHYDTQEEAVNVPNTEITAGESVAEIPVWDDAEPQQYSVNEPQENIEVFKADNDNQEKVENEEAVENHEYDSSNVEVNVENTIDAEATNQEFVADDIDLRYQAQAEETASVVDDSNVSAHNTQEVEIQNVDEGIAVAHNKTQEQTAGESNVESEIVESAAEIAVSENAEPQQYSWDESQVNAEIFEGNESVSPVIEESSQQAETQVNDQLTNIENQEHAHEGYNYEKPATTFTIPPPLPGQLKLEASFMHQELGSLHKSHRHGCVKRLKLHGSQKPVNDNNSCCGENWRQVVVDRSQVRPKNRHPIPYAEVIVDRSYFDQ